MRATDKNTGLGVKDLIYVPYMTDVPAGFYEVSNVNPLWIKDDEKGNFNGSHHDFGEIELVCEARKRNDT